VIVFSQNATSIVGWILYCFVFTITISVNSRLIAQSEGVRSHAENARSVLAADSSGLLFEERILSDNVLAMCRRAVLANKEDRFALLKQWVLPSETHSSLRIHADFSPTNPAPGNEELFTTAAANHGNRFQGTVGGELVSPAIELIRVARELGRLKEIGDVIGDLHPTDIEQQKAHLTMQSLLAIADDDLILADEKLRQLLMLATAHPGGEPERDPEAVALWAARHIPELHETARDLANLLHEDSRPDEMRRSERWKRQIAACRFLLDSKDPAASTVVTGGEIRVASAVHFLSGVNEPARTWHPVSREISETRGAGYPVSVWGQQPGRATHIAGHDHDYLYYVSPLRGNFAVEGDLTTHGFRDIHLGLGGYWAGVTFDLISTVSANFRYDEPRRPLNPPMTRMMDTMRVRMEVRDCLRTTFVNGRKVYERPHSENSDPWLSLHTWWLTNGMASNLRILGQPEIPDEISLLTPDLAGWTAYFDESVGYIDADWVAQSTPGKFGPAARSSLELLSRKRQDRKDTYSESLLRYHRPMAEDGTIRYSFFYEPGETLVHPVLDRLCFLVNPEGIDLHWITDGRHDPTPLAPDNISQELTHRQHSGSLPLKDKDWNQLALTLEGDVVHIDINDVRVYSRPLEPRNRRTFGLFHYADQTQVQVRDLRWKGNWPKTLEAPAAQELADTSLDKELGDRETLPGILQHNFSDGVPSHLFSFVGVDWEKNTQQLPDGLRVIRPGGEYVNYAILSPILLSGDFDIIAEFSGLKTEVIDGGEGSVQLSLKLDDERASELHFFRKRYVFEGKKSEEVIQPAIFEKRGTETQFTFLSAPAEESTSGRMRTVRRGTNLFWLYAERDSTEFRLIHRETVSDADTTVRLVVGHHKTGSTSVIWKSLDIRAESAFGGLGGPLKTLAELDAERDKLPAKKVWDFRSKIQTSSPDSLKSFLVWGDQLGKFSADMKGLTIEVPGTDEWQAAGLSAKADLHGDFDVSLEVDVVHLEPCVQYNESCVFLVAEFQDVRKSTSETKYAIHSEGDRKAETQLRRVRRGGDFDYQELVSRRAENATLLRLARRGDVVYQIFQSEDQATPEVLGAMKIGSGPVSSGYLRALIHTGGANRKTIIRFKSLQLQAEKLDLKE
jgi:hypothetical protein